MFWEVLAGQMANSSEKPNLLLLKTCILVQLYPECPHVRSWPILQLMKPYAVSTAVQLKEMKGDTAVSGFLLSATALTLSVKSPYTLHPDTSESTQTHFS